MRPLKKSGTSKDEMVRDYKKALSCRCCGKLEVRVDLIPRLLSLGVSPGRINSGFRCKKHNKAVGGSQNSYHKRGMAVDVACLLIDQPDFVKRALAAGFRGIGWYQTFVHIDLGPRREWKG